MSLRISSALAACGLGLAGCAPSAGALPGEPVECAMGKAGKFAPDCSLELEPEPGRFVLYHRGGGFRRLVLDAGTMMVTAADGAERVVDVVTQDDHLAFALGDARYRVPLRLVTGEP